ncbi:MAG: hypothetical protein ACRETM_03830 [Stenotrophobium sp.]
MFKAIIVAVVVLSLIGCTSVLVVPGSDPQAILKKIKPGDQVEILTMKGQTYQMEVAYLSPLTVTGVEDQRRYTIAYSQIKSIEISKLSHGKTNGLIFGILGAITVIAAGAFFLMLIQASNSSK